MRIRTKYQLITAALIASVVVSIAAMVIHTQRQVLRGQSARRMDAVMEGAARIAKESFDARDRLMAVSYLMFLQKEHPELAFASLSSGGRVSRLGSENEGLVYLERSVFPSGKPVVYTVSAYPSPSGSPGADLKVSTAGVSLNVSGTATVHVSEPAEGRGISVKLGFTQKMIDDEVRRALEPLMRWTAGIAGAFMLLGLFANVWVTGLLTGPIEALARATGLLAAGQLDTTVPVRTNDEMGALTESFNSMAGRLKELVDSREDILHTLSHEINTPLGGLKGYLELLQDGKLAQEPGEDQRVTETMMAAVIRMETSLGNALKLFRGEQKTYAAGEDTIVMVDVVFHEAITMFMPIAHANGVTIMPLAQGSQACMTAPEELVRRIVNNLVSNAIKYTPAGGTVGMDLAETETDVVFHVRNTGRGIPADDIPHLFTKFYRSGTDREKGARIPGTGLGLSIVHKAVTALGGEICVKSRPDKMTWFFVRLPKRRKHV